MISLPMKFLIFLTMCVVALFFILTKVILPVPTRIPVNLNYSALPFSKRTHIHWPYTKHKTFHVLSYEDEEPSLPFFGTKTHSISAVESQNSAKGLVNIGVGIYPIAKRVLQGFVVDENHPLLIKKINHQNIAGQKKLRLAITSLRQPKDGHCSLEIKTSSTSNPIQFSLPPLTALPWYERFKSLFVFERVFPDLLDTHEKFFETTIELKEIVPESLTVQIQNSTSSPSLPSLRKTEEILNHGKCVFAIGDLSVETETSHEKKNRGTIFIVIDTLRQDIAYNSNLMPNLNRFSQSASVFKSHRANGNMTVPSIFSLMTSRYPRELGNIAFAYAPGEKTRLHFYKKNFSTLPIEMEERGFRVGAIGSLSLFNSGIEGGVDLGFQNLTMIETYEYETRQITEEAGKWLQKNAHAPFFLYLHYNTMHGPYKPPFDKLKFQHFLSNPNELSLKSDLYEGLARYYDDEFEKLLTKLNLLGLIDDVDIFITADHGAQFQAMPFGTLMGANQIDRGGFADKAHTLLDEEILVPLIIKKSNQNFSQTVSRLTMHADLLPTILEEVDENFNSSPQKWQGTSLASTLAGVDQKELDNRIVYFDAHRYAGIVFQNKDNQTWKYIKQFTPDKANLLPIDHFTGKRISWFQPEQITSITHNKEKFVPIVSQPVLKEMRKKYNHVFPGDTSLKLTFHFSGSWNATLCFQNSFSSPVFELIPLGIKISDSKMCSHQLKGYQIEGVVKKNEILWVDFKSNDIKDFITDDFTHFVFCPPGISVNSKEFLNLFEKSCSFYPPQPSIVEMNFDVTKNKMITVQKTLSGDQTQDIEISGAGNALKKALEDWGYAK